MIDSFIRGKDDALNFKDAEFNIAYGLFKIDEDRLLEPYEDEGYVKLDLEYQEWDASKTGIQIDTKKVPTHVCRSADKDDFYV